MKKVCMLSSHHNPLDARIFYKEAISLQRSGYDVTIVAPFSDDGYFKDIAGNKILEIKNGKLVMCRKIRFRGFTYVKSSIPKINYFINQNRISKEIEKIGIEENADIYHCHEFTSLMAGIKLKKKMKRAGRNIKLIYDVHEFWPGVYQDKIKWLFLGGSIIRKIISLRERRWARMCDFIITANQIVRGYFLLDNRFAKVEVLYNCPILDFFKVSTSEERKDSKILCHEGSLPFNRGLKTMIRVMKRLIDDGVNVKLLIVGDVFGKEKEWVEEVLDKLELKDIITRTGWLPYENVGASVTESDIGIIFMKPIVNNMLAGPPNKLFNYMACGLPIIAPDFPEMRQIITESECGVLVETENDDFIYSAIKSLLENSELCKKMGKNGRNASELKYNWKEMEKKLLRIYNELI